jgi:YidC/Oxa1 family membrane protein insertase
MDRNTITGLVLIFVIFIGFSLYNNNKKDKSFESVVAVADSLYNTGNLENARSEYQKALQYKPGDPNITEKITSINQVIAPFENLVTNTSETAQGTESETTSNVPAVQASSSASDFGYLGDFSASGDGELSFITLRNGNVDLKISNKGGRIYRAELPEYKTHDGLPLVMFDGDSTVFGFKFFTVDNKPIETNDLFFQAYKTPQLVDATNTTGTVIMRLESGDKSYIEYTYTLEPDSYMVDFDVSFVGMNDKIASRINPLAFDWKTYIKQQEKGRQNEDMYSNIKYRHFNDEVDGFRDRSNKDTDIADVTTKVEWVAFKDQFFSTILINEQAFSNGVVEYTKLPEDSKYTRYCTADMGLPFDPSATSAYNMKIYIGPNHYKTLESYGHELQELVMLGSSIIRWINQYVIVNLFNWLNKSIVNYGLIILILTLIIKMVLFPLTFKSYQSQAKMKVLKPLIDEIGKKFPKKEDSMKKQQATMDLYKKAGVSPMGGCLPMALQMPILFAMFRFFPASIELRQESFLWATDLSTYDSILDLPFNIPMYGDHVSLFTILMTVSTIITMRINSPQSGQEGIPGMKTMMYMMPVMFMLILNNFSSGLTYYYFLANIITFVQNMIAKRFINPDEVLNKLEANKKKAPTKSKFQKRLEEAAKQKGYKSKK